MHVSEVGARARVVDCGCGRCDVELGKRVHHEAGEGRGAGASEGSSSRSQSLGSRLQQGTWNEERSMRLEVR